MKKPLTPLVKKGSYIASKHYTPLVYPGGKTTNEDPNHGESDKGKKTGENESKANGES